MSHNLLLTMYEALLLLHKVSIHCMLMQSLLDFRVMLHVTLHLVLLLVDCWDGDNGPQVYHGYTL